MPDPDIPVFELQNSNGTTIAWIRADTNSEELELAADGDDIVLKDAVDLDGNSIRTVNDITGQSGSVTVIDGGGGSGSELRLQNGTSSNSVKIQESDDLIIDAEDATLTNAKGNDVQVIGGNGDGTGAQGDVIINANALAPDTDGTGNVGTDSTTWSNGEFQNIGGGGSSVSVDDDLDLQSSQSVTNASSVSTEQADITNETVVKANRQTDTSTITAGTHTNIVDTQVEDNRTEYNSSNEFVPDETGDYTITAQARLRDGSSGDGMSIRIYNKTDSSILSSVFKGETSGDEGIAIHDTLELTTGKSYVVQARNSSSSFTIFGNPQQTKLTITRSVVDG